MEGKRNLEAYMENIDDDSDSDDGSASAAAAPRRLVVFGQLDLTAKAGLAHHWGVKLVECPHDPPCDAGAGVAEGEEEEETEPNVKECLETPEGIWFEVDGFQMDDPRNLKHNSINGSDDYSDPGEWKGIKSRLNSVPQRVVGVTKRSDMEIYVFNRDYLARNPKYSLLRNNCQNYADELCDFLCRDDGVLEKMGILLENVEDALRKVYDHSPDQIKDLVDKAEAAAADEDSVVHDAVETAKSGFAKFRAFKKDYKAKLKAKFGGHTTV